MTTKYPLAVMRTVWRRLNKAKAANIIGSTLTAGPRPRISRVTRYLQVAVIIIPWLILTFHLKTVMVPWLDTIA